jgi:hypothetical protein
MAGPILLVHDDIAAIASVRRLLTRAGHEVVLATSASDALIAFGHHLPALIVLAPSVEGDRGHVVLEELRNHPDGALARVVLLGESAPGFSYPVVPLPLEGRFFLDTVREVMARPPTPTAEPTPAREETREAVAPEGTEPEGVQPASAPLEVESAEPEGALAKVGEAAVATGPNEAPPGEQDAKAEADAPVVQEQEPEAGWPSQIAQAVLAEGYLHQVPAVGPAEEPPREAQAALTDERQSHPQRISRPATSSSVVEPRQGVTLPARSSETAPPSVSLEAAAPRAPSVPPTPASVPNVSPEAAAPRAPPAPPALGTQRVRPKAAPVEEAIAVPSEARMARDELCRSALKRAERSATGRWVLRGTEFVRELWLEGGMLVGAKSTHPGESLLERAHRDGLLNLAQQRELRLLRHASDSALLEAMRQRGYLRETEVVPLRRRAVEQVALEALSEPLTAFSWQEGQTLAPDERAASVRPFRALIVEGLRRAMDPDELERRAGHLSAIPRWLVVADVADFGFSERELRLCASVDGRTSLEALIRLSGVRQELARRCLASLEALGLLVFEPPLRPTYEPRVAELDAQRLLARFQASEEADYFELLGLPRTAGRDEVSRAYKLLSEEFNPLRYVGHPDPALQGRAQRLAEAFAEAAEALTDDRLRARYAKNLVEG